MKTRLISGMITIACAIIAAMVIIYARGGDNTHATTDAVVQRASSATAKLADAIGPNTTFHQVVIQHDNGPVTGGFGTLPADTKDETWMAFGADGNVVSQYTVTTDLGGKQVYQTQVFTPPSTLILTDVATGKTITLPRYGLSAATAAAAFAKQQNNLITAIAASGAPAPTARDAAGHDTYVLTIANERLYLDKSSYRLVQIDEIADDGSVKHTKSFTVLEVLPGNVVPSVTPIAGLTTTPYFPTAPEISTDTPVAADASARPVDVLLACEVEPACVFSDGTAGVDVDVVLRNNADATSIAAFNFDLWNQSKALLNPNAPAPNLTFLSDAGWNCTSPAPAADTFSGAPGTSTSRISCTNSAGNNAVPSGDSIIATVHFAVSGTGASLLLLSNVAVADPNGTALVTCDPADPPPAMPSGAGLADCPGVTVQVGG